MSANAQPVKTITDTDKDLFVGGGDKFLLDTLGGQTFLGCKRGGQNFVRGARGQISHCFLFKKFSVPSVQFFKHIHPHY